MAIAVSIVEDDPDLRATMSALIRGTPNFNLVGAYGSAEEALRSIPQSAPDVVLMDIHLPRLSGIECVRQLKTQLPDLVVVMLTEREELVLRQLAKGWRYKEIAADLGVGVETVHTHIRHIYAKLHVTSRTEAVVTYLGR